MTQKRTRKKRKWTTMRFRKKDTAHNLLAATQHWLESQGYRPVIIGGIGIMDEGGNRYRVCVGCLGVVPKFYKEKP